MPSTKTLAIFDLDYTLTKRGTWGRFSWQVIKTRPWLYIPFLAAAIRAQLRYKKGLIPRVQVKEAMIRWSMIGKPKAEMLAHAARFADREVPNLLRPGGLRKLREHQQAGDEVIIISAAADIIVAAICERLDVNYFLASNMGWDGDNRLKAEFASPNCYGEEKVKRYQAFLEEYPEIAANTSGTIMYSDSHADVPLMSICDQGVAVHPSDKLRALADQYKFTIVDWNS